MKQVKSMNRNRISDSVVSHILRVAIPQLEVDYIFWLRSNENLFLGCAVGIQSGRENSAINVTGDYLYYKEPKSPYNFLLF